MRKASLLHAVLGIVGLTAWGLFILGCLGWSSWSPDSSKVVFPYAQGEPKLIGIALYDRITQKVSPIFVQSANKGDDSPFLQAQWAGDGKSIVITVANDSYMDVFVSAVEPGSPTRHVHVSAMKNLFAPYPELWGTLYFSKENEIVSLDLASGIVGGGESKGAPYALLFASGNELLYMKEAEPDKPSIEIGTIELPTLDAHSLFQFNPDELGFELRPQVAGHPESERYAMSAEGKQKQQDSILLFSWHGLEKVLTPDDLPEKTSLGNVQWSKDGSLIYAGVFIPISHGWQYSLAEIPLAGNPTRLTPICKIKDSISTDDLPVFLDISLSPDGRTISTTSGLIDPADIDETDRALFLIDVQGSKRSINKIPLPALSPSPTRSRGGK